MRARLLAAAVALFAAAAPAGAAAFECHTALVLALDSSRSVDSRENRLQREGLAAALRDPEVIAAIAPYPDLGAAMSAFEWSDPDEQLILAPWTVMGDRAAIEAFAGRLVGAPQIDRRLKTGIGAALRFAVGLHQTAPVSCRRKVIDVSGDGPGNDGPHPKDYRRAGLFDGLVINGLVIRHPALDSAQPPGKDPLIYYQRHVVQGPGAFLMTADTFEDYAEAIKLKLLRELSPSLAAR